MEAARGLAALGVVVCHARGLHDPPAWTSPLRHGWLGVPVFFVLSGIVLYLPFADGSRPANALVFWVRRLLRIFPAYWAAFALCAVAVLVTGGTLMKPLSQFVLTNEYQGMHYEALLPQSWTLAVELGFYLLLPALIWIIWRWPALRWPLLVALVVVASWYRLLMNPVGGHLHPFPFAPLGFLQEFAVGMAAAVVISRRQRSWLFIPTGAAVIVTAFVCFEESVGGWPFMDVFAVGIALMLIPIAQLGARLPAAFVWLGTVSFGIYLWHVPIIAALGWTSWQAPWLLQFTVALMLTFVAAWASWTLVERRAIRIGRRVGVPRASRGPDADVVIGQRRTSVGIGTSSGAQQAAGSAPP